MGTPPEQGPTGMSRKPLQSRGADPFQVRRGRARTSPSMGQGRQRLPSPQRPPGQAIDIQSTDELSRSSPQSGFWTHVSQISLAAFKQCGLEQAQEQSVAERGHPAHPCVPRRSSSIQMLMRLSGLSASLNGGGLHRQTAIVATPGRDSGNSWFFSQRHLLETFLKNCFI